MRLSLGQTKRILMAELKLHFVILCILRFNSKKKITSQGNLLTVSHMILSNLCESYKDTTVCQFS
jgi:hypothetical protein